VKEFSLLLTDPILGSDKGSVFGSMCNFDKIGYLAERPARAN